jgi:hypothetical protein
VRVRRGILSILVVCVASCERASARDVGPPTRLVAGHADTVVVNSRSPAALPVHVLDSAGHELSARGVRFAWLSGAPIRVSDSGHVMCRQRLDAEVRATLGELSTRFVLLCRPIKAFQFLFYTGVPLVSGGPPRQLDVHAVGLDGEPVTAFAATMTVADTNVADVRGFTIYPKRPGNTEIELDIGDCAWPTHVEVNERVASPLDLRRREQVFMESPLRLFDGQRRGWRLPRGEYRVALVPEVGREAGLLLGTSAMNCSLWLGGGQDYHCIALEGASVNVRNPRRVGRGGELTGTLFMQRWDVPYSASAEPERPRRLSMTGKRYCRMDER